MILEKIGVMFTRFVPLEFAYSVELSLDFSCQIMFPESCTVQGYSLPSL